MEKAFSKLHGTYARTAGGDPSRGVSYLTGSPSEYIFKRNNLPEEEQVKDQWTRMYDAFNAGGMLTCGTPCDNGGDDT